MKLSIRFILVLMGKVFDSFRLILCGASAIEGTMTWSARILAEDGIAKRTH